MRTSTFTLIFLLSVILQSPLPAAQDNDAARILTRYFDTIGGTGELDKITNLSVRIDFEAFDYGYTATLGKEGSFRIEAENIVTIFDGSSYWRSFHGLAGRLSSDEIADYANYSLRETIFQGLLGPDGKPVPLEYKGVEKKHRHTYEVLASADVDGRVTTFYFNKETGLLDKKVELVDDAEYKQLKNIYYYRNYSDVGRVKLFTEAEAICLTNGETILPLSRFSDFTINETLADNFFGKPENEAPAATFENGILTGEVIGLSARGSAIANFTETDLRNLDVEDGALLKIKIKDQVSIHAFFENLYSAPGLGPGDYLATFSNTPALWIVKAYVGMTSDQAINEGDPVSITLQTEDGKK